MMDIFRRPGEHWILLSCIVLVVLVAVALVAYSSGWWG